MTTGNRIGNFDAWANLEARYSLEARAEGVPKSFADIVVPVADADSAIAVHELEVDAQSLAGTLGTFNQYFTVPNGEEWLVWLIHREGTTGVSSVRGLINQRNGVVANVPLSLPGTGEAFLPFSNLRLLGGGGGLGMLNSGNGADSAIDLRVFYRRLPAIT